VTEPPDPRRPAEGGGDEDYDAIWESAGADEILDGLEDDALLDSIARGTRGNLGPDELTELLSGLRDVPDSTDLYLPHLGRVERGENVLEPSGPRQTSEGNPPSMMSESLALLNQVANDTSAAGPLAEANNGLEAAIGNLIQSVSRVAELRDQALQAVNGNTVDEGEIGSAGEHAAGAVEEAIEAVNAAAAAISLAVQHEAAFRQTVGGVAQKHAG
jgi:hypothetical protein